MAKEKNLWLLLRTNLPQLHLQRIETGMTGAGVPDVNGCAKGKEFWIELKEIHSGNALTLRPMQISWLAKRASFGVKSSLWLGNKTKSNSTISTV
jgi:hypothetical protein